MGKEAERLDEIEARIRGTLYNCWAPEDVDYLLGIARAAERLGHGHRHGWVDRFEEAEAWQALARALDPDRA